MRLPDPSARYDQQAEGRRNREIEQADARNLKRQQDIEFTSGMRLIMPSPDGTRWSLTVSNAGALVLTAL